ncbi:uncharacterized protein DDB_G0280205-like [Varroa destructor]|uniref:Uncharacterized protein n=1 Tax=Varroa destructor TaxID=109461 RepID=A0A7M7J5Q3_VARDE|nr:uncharacterized protein DDB_G0280205-like [Varroa destructor]XP_022646523.1 uncharacterized protein DDB_G0280205-like [Varroa destructor]XP_022646524.1 uncharacterized protein DDB_G0280205-like [Varroa destructor]XP_022646525.1 uncharacterized protein DDB_G0280205-like [Varroa destructor]XP_022646526.1 uncharacterized protein DDB_G0280205-like [Varroa destructor]XP_022646527.1 uncharacterized protein DDB_G0280205-like [Varroa destructor]XP_022646528.1 uncharacterized protein DDB_G0280205-l
MGSSRRSTRSTEEHLSLGLPVLFSELLVFKWTPNNGFPAVTDEFRLTFDHMQEVENLGNELRVFFASYDEALTALENSEVRRNTFRFLDQYGTIEDLLKNEILRTINVNRGLIPECLEERIRNQQKWYKGDDNFSLEFAREFLRRKFSAVRNPFHTPQPTGLLPPLPPPRKHKFGSSNPQQSLRPPDGHLFDSVQPPMSQAMSVYTASGRPRRNSAPLNALSPPKPRRHVPIEQLPSPPPTPPPLRSQREMTQYADSVSPTDNVSNGSVNDPRTTEITSEHAAENGAVPLLRAEITSNDQAETLSTADVTDVAVNTSSSCLATFNCMTNQRKSGTEETGGAVEVSQDESSILRTVPTDFVQNTLTTTDTTMTSPLQKSDNGIFLLEMIPGLVDHVAQEAADGFAQRVFFKDSSSSAASIQRNNSSDRPSDNDDMMNNNNNKIIDNNNANNIVKRTGMLAVTDKLIKDENRLLEYDRLPQETAM